MSRSKYTTPVCIIVSIIMMVSAMLLYAAEEGGLIMADTSLPYEDSLFDTSVVHTLDLTVDEDEWDNMIANASAKEYISADIVLDGTSMTSVAIRPKGNSSLSMMSADSERYSFKLEFDHYVDAQTYMGLDKLALNNIIQDNTYLKDYLSYELMRGFGANAPLCSFIYITLNGEDFGLYLAVEGIEESYAYRNFGADYGQIYKPDTMDIAGGMNNRENGGGMNFGDIGDIELPEGFDEIFDENGDIDMDKAQELIEGQGGFGGGFDIEAGDGTDAQGGRQNFVVGGMGGSSAVALQYIDDEHDSYADIFDSAKFDITDADKDRLISTLKQLSEGENISEIVNIEEVLRYFVVHNFLLNFDSYTGSMTHNYYLYEDDGMISMIAWDYNLSFGAFSMGGGISGTDSATTLANYPIDTPVSGATMESRPLLNQLLSDPEYLELYHELFAEFITEFFDEGKCGEIISSAVALIGEYVEKDPTAFCTYEEFLTGSTTLAEFCELRGESIALQLSGDIPATSDGQAADSSSFVDASHIDINSMGTNSGGMGGFGNRGNRQTDSDTGGAGMFNWFGGNTEPAEEADEAEVATAQSVQLSMDSSRMNAEMPEGGFAPPEGMEEFAPPDGMTFPEDGEFTPPDGMTFPDGGDFTMPEGMEEFTPAETTETAEADTADGENTEDDTSSGDTASSEASAGGSDNGSTDGSANGQAGNQNNMRPGGNWNTQTAAQTTPDYTQYIYLGISFLLILAGIVFAKLFK